MHIKKLHCLEEALACLLEEQMECLEAADTVEMGEVIDMIKDIEETRYYNTLIKAMEGSSVDTEKKSPDKKEGCSYHSRKSYLAAKESHAEKAVYMRELEKYMQELAQDISDMVEGASPEERTYLSKKIAILAEKLQQG